MRDTLILTDAQRGRHIARDNWLPVLNLPEGNGDAKAMTGALFFGISEINAMMMLDMSRKGKQQIADNVG